MDSHHWAVIGFSDVIKGGNGITIFFGFFVLDALGSVKHFYPFINALSLLFMPCQHEGLNAHFEYKPNIFGKKRAYPLLGQNLRGKNAPLPFSQSFHNQIHYHIISKCKYKISYKNPLQSVPYLSLIESVNMSTSFEPTKKGTKMKIV